MPWNWVVPVFAAAEIQSNESWRLRQFQCWDGTAGQVDDSVTIVHKYQPDKKISQDEQIPPIPRCVCSRLCGPQAAWHSWDIFPYRWGHHQGTERYKEEVLLGVIQKSITLCGSVQSSKATTKRN